MTLSHPAEGDALVERLIGQWKAVMEACARTAEDLMPVPHRLRLQEREIASQLVGRLLSKCEALSAENARLKERVAALEAGLRPFAYEADKWGPADQDGDCFGRAQSSIQVEECREARAILARATLSKEDGHGR